jgi:hypothetical protein
LLVISPWYWFEAGAKERMLSHAFIGKQGFAACNSSRKNQTKRRRAHWLAQPGLWPPAAHFSFSNFPLT